MDRKKLSCILSLIPVWPQDLIYVARNVLPGQTAREVSPRVAQEALTGLGIYVPTCLLHSLEQWDPQQWVTLIDFPPPGRKELLNGVEEWRVWWEELSEKLWVVAEPVTDRSRPVETYVVPDYNVVDLLRPVYLVWWNEQCVKFIKEREETGGVVWTHGGMVMKDTVVVNGSTHGDVSSTLAGDLDNGTLADNIPSPAPSFDKVETRLINKNKLVYFCSCV